MKVSGFTFIRNAIAYDYPIVEAIQSILPICDECVVAVGKSQDHTLDLISNIDSKKIKIVETEWDETLREGGKVLAVETNKAFQKVSKAADWAFYIQGDEVVHEKYLDTIYQAMKQCKDIPNIDGLLFKYLHFYGSYDFVGSASNWYKHEIRVIKNNPSIYSYGDAQGFRMGKNKKLRVHPIDAYVYHYGWVKHPKNFQKKARDFNKLWNSDQWVEKNITGETYDFHKSINELMPFEDTHPKVMQNRIQEKNWTFEYDISFNKITLKERIKRIVKKLLGIDLVYKNYKIAKL